MTDLAKYIVTPLTGAVIGYITNWLAIKMLFRPLTEKRIFGFKVPFTPGLIPKERGVLAQKVAETIDTHLLTGEALSRSLSSPETVAALQGIVSETFENLKTNTSSIGDKLKNFLELKKLSSEIEDIFIGMAMDYAKSEVTKAKLLHFFEEKAKLILDDPAALSKLEELFRERSFEIAKESLLSFAEAWRNENKTFNEVIPDEIWQFYYEQSGERLPGLLNFAAEQLKNNETLNEKLSQLTVKLVEDTVNPLMGLFIKPEKVYSGLREHLIAYIENPDNHPIIFENIDQFVKTLAGYKISDLLSRFPEEDISRWADILAEKIREHIRLSDYASNFREAANKFIPDFDSKLRLYLYRVYEEAVETYAEQLFHQIFETAESRFLCIRVADIASRIFASFNFSDVTEVFIRSAVERYSGDIIRAVNIKDIVESNINELEIDEAEKIIVSVVNKELRSITVLGGVLGFLIGSLTVLFS